MLTTEQIETFERDGMLVVEDVLDADTLDALREDYRTTLDALYRAWQAQGLVPPCEGFPDQLMTAYRAGIDWFQPLDISLPGERIAADTPMHLSAETFALVTHPRLLDIAQSLLGPELTSNPIQHVRIKPPERDLQAGEQRAHVGGTAWHQDRGVAHEEADGTRMVTVWVAVTDATQENGCLLAAPRAAHLVPHCPRAGQMHVADGFLDPAAARPLPVRAGGVVLLHPLTPHAALPNRSNGLRWSFDLRYNVTGEPTGRAHFPAFVARSRSDPRAELGDWREWRRMWEDARARLAARPHIDIHRWSADAPVCA